MSKDDIYTLNQGLESRTSTTTGKTRFNIVVKSEPLILDLNERRLMAPMALAVAHHLRERVKGIAARAPEATLRARAYAAKKAQEGAAWARRRYSGGRIGEMPGNQTDRAFNDSGRFAESIKAGVDSKGTWRVNVAVNRLTDKESGGAARIWSKLVQYVPEFGSMEKLLTENAIVAAMEKSLRGMITKGRPTTGKVSALDLAKAVAKTLGNAARLVEEAVG